MDTRVPSFPGVYCGIVGAWEKGDCDYPMLITNEGQCLSDLTNDEKVKVGSTSAYYSILAALQKSNKVWAVRAANKPKYGACYLKPDKSILTHGISVNSGTDTLMLNHASEDDLAVATSLYNMLSTGDKITVSVVTGTLPAPLVALTTYYVILADDENFRIRLATSLSNAYNNIFIDLTDVGSGSLSINIPTNSSNGESEFPISLPSSYDLGSSDGKPAGSSSIFSVDIAYDAFNTSANFYNMVSTGDVVRFTATTFPTVDSGAELLTATDYYIIKLSLGSDIYKVQIARTLNDANSGTFIGILSTGNAIVGTLQNKDFVDATITLDYTLDVFTTTAKFWNGCATGDKIRLSTTNAFPTVSDTPAIDANTDYYIMKGVANTFQLSRSSSTPVAMNFTSAGTGQMTVTQQTKTNTSTFAGDLSGDVLTVSETFYENLVTGFSCTVSSTGTLPPGLSAQTYYIIRTSTANKIKLASTSVNATMGISVDITDAGTGIHTILDTHNTALVGLDQKLMLIYTKTPCAEDIYIKTLHYPYGDSSTWTADQKDIAGTVKEPNAFLLYVYKKDSDGNYYEAEGPFLLSRTKGHKDGNGVGIYCEERITASSYIRILDNDSVDSSLLPIDQSQYLKLTNGSQGLTVSDSDMLLALDQLKSRRNIFVTVLMDGGWTTPAYQKQGLIQLCENRKDCVAILNVPIAYEQSSDYMNSILNYRKEELNASTSYAALYSSHLYIQDKYNDRKIYVPCDGYVAAAISETAANYEIWYPAAGASRGQLNVLDVARRFTEGEMDVLYDNGINPIDFYPGKGIRIWGNKTLLARPCSLDRLNVRMLLITIEPAIAEFLEDFLFEFNDEITRIRASSGIVTYMDDIKSRRGVYAYTVKCDSENNTPAVIDANKLLVDLYIQPVKSAEFIEFRTIITPTGWSFKAL